ncbi:hypothetical protein BDV12DRAFT_201393 [Aspergillus spectabilis]
MALFRPLAISWLILSPTLAQSIIEYPTTLEIDILYPREISQTRNTWIPMIFAVQGADAAFLNRFSLDWTLAPEDDQDDFFKLFFYTYSSHRDPDAWRYGMLEENTAIVLNTEGFTFSIPPGRYNLTWELTMMTCRVVANQPELIGGEKLVSRSYLIDVVESQLGDLGDLEDWLDECPVFGGKVPIADAVSIQACPVIAQGGHPDELREGKPCNARLQNEDQKECIRRYFGDLPPDEDGYAQEYQAGPCRDGFDVLPLSWQYPESMTWSTSSSTENLSALITSATTTTTTSSTVAETHTPTTPTSVDKSTPTLTPSESGAEGEPQDGDDGGLASLVSPLGYVGLARCVVGSLLLLYFV